MNRTTSCSRVFVSGMSVIWNDDTSLDGYWNSLLSPPTPTPTSMNRERIDAEFSVKERRRTTPTARLMVSSGLSAFADSGSPEVGPFGGGISVGAGFDVTDFDAFISSVDAFREHGTKGISPSLALTTMPNIGAAYLGSVLGWGGPTWSVAAGCASSAVAICQAADAVALGRVTCAIAGGASELGGTLFSPRTVLANLRVHSDAVVSTPFGDRPTGFVHSEGAASVVLESEESLRARGGRAYAELAGWATATDDTDMIAPSPTAAAMIHCYRSALDMAGVSASAVGLVNPHGSGTRANDESEEFGIEAVFGDTLPLVSATKATTGHLSSGAGAIEAVATVLAMHHGLVPPTAHTTVLRPDCRLPVVLGEASPWVPGSAISSNLGLGGHNAALLFRAPPEDLRRREPTRAH